MHGFAVRGAPPIFFDGVKENGPCTVQKKTLLGPKLRHRRSLGQTGVVADTALEF